MDSETIININLEDESYVALEPDLEAQQINRLTIKNSDGGTVPLKGILRQSSLERVDSDSIVSKCLSICLVSFVILPIIISDLYFGFEPSCNNNNPEGLVMLKLYLLASGFFEMTSLLYLIHGICYLSKEEESTNIVNCKGYTPRVAGLIYLGWNIFGFIILYQIFYGVKLCSAKTLSYVNISLIIKFISSLVLIKNK